VLSELGSDIAALNSELLNRPKYVQVKSIYATFEEHNVND
jgi:hypothetical protein